MDEQRYQETLAYLYQQLPMFQREGKAAYKKDLTNTRDLCWVLGLPQWRIKTIHIAGTNGKGSVSSMLASVLTAAGYRVGLYTSPHLVDFTERIRVDGQPMAKEAVVSFVDQMKPHIADIQPSFFELTVAMAFQHFVEEEVDIAVIETGMGGRLDSTNVLRPEFCAITNISWDHAEYLGDTLSKIAGEKAGIIKPYTPVVIGGHQAECDWVFEEQASIREAPLTYATDRYEVQRLQGDWKGQRLQLTDRAGGEVYSYDLDLPGLYQPANLLTVRCLIDLMLEDGWEMEETDVARGLRSVRQNSGLRGRMEQLGEHPLVLCDVGHNEAGVASILQQLGEFDTSKLHFVWGMVSDKEHEKILTMLPKAATYYWTCPSIPRGYPADQLQAKGTKLGLSGKAYASVAAAKNAALQAAPADAAIFIGGSTFVVADALGEAPELASS